MDPESNVMSSGLDEQGSPKGEAGLDEKAASDNSSESSETKRPPNFWVTLASDLLFLVGSTFYMWLSVLDFQWQKQIESIIHHFKGDGDENFSWKDYDFDDDYVFKAGNYWVSEYQIIFFIAAAAFALEGFVEFFGTPGFSGLFFIYAGCFGLLSAWLGERHTHLSNIFNLMSAHLYMCEALGIMCNRKHFHGRWVKFLIRVSDVCFVLSTCIDTALSYTAVLDKFDKSLSKLGVAASALWLTTAVIYVGVTLYGKWRGYFDRKEDTTPEEKDGLLPKEAVENEEQFEDAKASSEGDEQFEDANASSEDEISA